MKKIITRIITVTMLLAPLSTFGAKGVSNRKNAPQTGINRQSQPTTKVSRPVTRNVSVQRSQLPAQLPAQLPIQKTQLPTRAVPTASTRQVTSVPRTAGLSTSGIRQTTTGIATTGRSRTAIRPTSGDRTFAGARVAGTRNISGDRHGQQVHGRDYARNRSHMYRYNRGWATLGLGLGLIGSGYLDPYWNYYYGGRYWGLNDAIYGYCPYHDMVHGCYFRRTFCDLHDQYHYIWDACPM